jgi:protease I
MERISGGDSGSISRRHYMAATAAALAAPILASAAEVSSPAKGGKVLFVVGDGTETVDTLYPIYRVQEDDFVPVIAGIEKKRYHMVLHEMPSDWEVTREFEGYTIQAEIAFRDVKPEEYTGVFFSGGRAPEYLRYDKDLMRITRHFFEANKPVGSVCHGVEIPARAGVLKGRRIATVPKCQFDVEDAGGTFVNAPCVVDGNLVSGRTFHDHGHYIGKWVALLRAAREKA